VKEPFIALGVCAVWGIYGAIYFKQNSAKKGRAMMSSKPVATA
jgi:hypothetical protein